MAKIDLKDYLISIHALREEGDLRHPVPFRGLPEISIHALREEGDVSPPGSRPPGLDFYPRPPRGGRRERGRRLPCW